MKKLLRFLRHLFSESARLRNAYAKSIRAPRLRRDESKRPHDINYYNLLAKARLKAARIRCEPNRRKIENQ